MLARKRDLVCDLPRLAPWWPLHQLPLHQLPLVTVLKKAFGLATTVGFLSVLAGVATAQTIDKSAAVTLFDEAQRLGAAGKYAEACPKYAESNRLDPQLGALLHLADCYEKVGQLASAWAAFRDAADLADRRADERSLTAKDRAAALESRLSHLTIVVPAGSAAPGLEVRRDGILVGSALWGTAIPVDPGRHTVVVTASGRAPWRVEVEMQSNGTAETINVPALLRTEVPGPKPKQLLSPDEDPEPAVDHRAAAGGLQRTLGLVAAGVGVVGIGVGAALMLQRINKLEERADLCPGSICQNHAEYSRLRSLEDDARSASIRGTIGLIAGGAFLAGGVALLLTAPSNRPGQALEVRPLVGSRGGMVMVGSDW